MLVLTRETGTRLWFGEDICITIIETRYDRVRVGVEAPAGVTVFREELLPKCKKCGRVMPGEHALGPKAKITCTQCQELVCQPKPSDNPPLPTSSPTS